MKHRNILTTIALTFTFYIYAQSPEDLNEITGGLDSEYLQSLPDDVRNDLLSEISKNSSNKSITLKKRPSTELLKYDTIKNWEKFQKEQLINEELSERYGINLFRTMQSSFMPINEPNFGSEYILDYGDLIEIRLFGRSDKRFYEEIKRDGSITVEGIGKIQLAGLNFDQAVEILNTTFKNTFIGSEIIVDLSQIRDIKILITGNAAYPGMYTISGNSNILQALNIAGGIKENGSLRDISITRDGKLFQSVDLYKALIFGDLDNIPTLRSGDSINVKPVKKLVRAGSGFTNQAVFELRENETFADLIKFAGGTLKSIKANEFNIIRLEKSKFNNFKLSFDKVENELVKNLDTINVNSEKLGTIEISGSVENPGIYTISSDDRLSDVIKRAGGYTDSAYTFGGALYRENVKRLEKDYADKSYNNIIRFIAQDTKILSSQGASFLPLLLSEIKNLDPVGRVATEFSMQELNEYPIKDIYVNDKDKIVIPKFESTVFVFGEVSNPGAIPYADGKGISYYLKNSGGVSPYAENKYTYIVSPDGIATRISQKGLNMLLEPITDVYPGSVIYVPREIGKIRGIDFYSTIAPVFSSLALSIASLNSIND